VKYRSVTTQSGQKILEPFSIYACHPCAGAMLIFSVSFQFYQMPEGNNDDRVVVYKVIQTRDGAQWSSIFTTTRWPHECHDIETSSWRPGILSDVD
jgi:hypothetical protein